METQPTVPLETDRMPNADEMYEALLERNAAYDGVFFVGVKTTGIFCRPTCPARKPLMTNVLFFPSASEAIAAGFRACQRCHPLRPAGELPSWLSPLLAQLEANLDRRWKDQDIRDLGVDPTRVCRWFKSNHGITFHAYLRSRRLSTALARLSVGDDLTQVALDTGYASLSGFRDAFQKWFGAPPGRASSEDAVLVNRILSPLGPFVVAATSRHLLLLEFADRQRLEQQVSRLAAQRRCSFCPGENTIIERTCCEVSQYFAGERQAFDVPVHLTGTEFQRAVWRGLQKIPYGQTQSYEALARAIGHPGASRAVGRANGDNRLAVIVPCHRVIRADGSLSGYGGGVRRKEWLLNHERAYG